MHLPGSSITPHLQLGSVRPPQRPHLRSGSKNKVCAIVFIHLNKPPFVKLLTGTKVPVNGKLKDELPTAKYQTKKRGSDALRMTHEEYVDCVRDAVEHFYPKQASCSGGSTMDLRSTKARHDRLKKLLLVHDRLLPHGTSAIHLGGGDPDLTTSRLPPRSPDLDPLDYGTFGPGKRATRARFSSHLDWDSESHYFVQTLRNMRTDNVIKEFPHRLKDCLAASGGHFEHKKR